MIDSAARLLVAPLEWSICPYAGCPSAEERGENETAQRPEDRSDRGDDQAEQRQDEREHGDGGGDVVVVLHHQLCGLLQEKEGSIVTAVTIGQPVWSTL